MRKPKTYAFSLALLTAMTPLLAREEPEPDPEATRAYREGYNLVLNGEWEAARGAFATLIRDYPESGWVDDAAFWRCYASAQVREPAEQVFACYETLVSQYPRSEWHDDAERAMVRLATQLDREGKSQYRDRVRDFGRGEDDRELMQVLVALGEIGDERSIEVMLQRLEATEDEHLRARIVDVLEDVDSPRVVEKLIEIASSDPSEQVRIAAIDAISEHQSIDAPAVLTQIAMDSAQPPRVRVEAIDELSDKRPPDLVQTLRELGMDADSRVAEEAINELADIGTVEALDALTALLGTVPDARRRLSLINEIEDFKSEAAVQILLNVATGDPDPRIRRAATDSLGDMDTESAREALIQLLQSMDEGEG